MRLTPEQAMMIREAVDEVLGEKARVYLFGSRVDDRRRGGDIDLYIELPMLAERRTRLQVRLQRRLWERLGPRRIDVLMRTYDEALQPIHRDALEQGVRL